MIYEPKQLDAFWRRTSKALGSSEAQALMNSPQRNEFFLNGAHLAAQELGSLSKVSEAHILQIFKKRADRVAGAARRYDKYGR
jgi:hypothetical protein